ncbi:MAG: SIS domain-containing protein [Propionicimonas sp.]
MNPNSINRHFPAELQQQPEVIERTAAELEQALPAGLADVLGTASRIIWTGSGDCYFVGHAICAFFESFAGIPAIAVEAYDFVNATPMLDEHTLVIGFSSSGKSVYAVEAVELARSLGARTLAVSNTVGNRLAEVAEFAISTPAGDSYTFPTKTTTAALVVALVLARLAGAERGWGGDARPPAVSAIAGAVKAAIAAAVERAPSLAGQVNAARRVVVVGSGLGRTAALIGSAKLIETCEIAASSNNCEEFLHLYGFGIREVDAVIVIDDGNLRSRLAADYAIQQGAHTIVVASEAVPEIPSAAHVLPIGPQLDEVTRLFSSIVALHALAAAVSDNRGTNPDIPAGVDLEYVIGLLYTDPVDGWNQEAAKGLGSAVAS